MSQRKNVSSDYSVLKARPSGNTRPVSYTHLDVNKRYQPAVEVVGDISESLYEILRCAHRTGEPEFALALRQTMVAEHKAMAADDSCPMKPARILADVRKVMGRDDILEMCIRDSQWLPLWGSWREAPERARMLAEKCKRSDSIAPTMTSAYRCIAIRL